MPTSRIAAHETEVEHFSLKPLVARSSLVNDFDFSPPFASVLGTRVSAVDLNSAVDLCDRWIQLSRENGYVCATGVHGIMEAYADSELRRILNHAFMNVPDGMPMTWVGRMQGFHDMDRVFGPDLMMAMCRLSVERGYRNFFYGGKPGVASFLSESLQRKIPGLQVVGTYTPPFRNLNSHEDKELLAQVRESRPHIIWVGLSTPKQERFMAQYVDYLQAPMMCGVGAAFDFHTGAIRDCSQWVKRAGLQWVHRLIQDPTHLWKRYLRNNPAFLWHIALQLSRLRQYPSAPEAGSIGPLHAVKSAGRTL
jgi:N-acetylglucosaminyldiphosphoundecaprenol N-acetyl-beta-D-mannosaminyltransferase